jgi:threonine dehydrogenase-like Zn-dependent dehydrogenase
MQNKKIVFSSPWEVNILSEHMDEMNLNPREIIIETEYTLVSPRTELACLEGLASWFEFPRTPGYVTQGKVIKTGNLVREYNEGDYVIHNSGHMKYSKIDVDEKLVVKIPEGVDHKYTVFTKMASIAMASIRKSNIELGDYVIITGLGLIGNFASQLAKLQGAKVLGLDVEKNRLDIAEKCGIKCKFNTDIFDYVNEFSNGDGISTLIDATGIPSVVVDSLPFMSKHNAEVILLGTPWNRCDGDLTEVFNYVHLSYLGGITFKGAHATIYPVKHIPYIKHSDERNSKIVLDLIREGKIIVNSLITHVIKPEETKKAYMGLKDNKNDYLGVIIDWN